MSKKTKKLNSGAKQRRQFVLTVSMFLLRQETMKDLVWTVHNVHYDRTNQVVRIGVDTMNGKLGTTLTSLRKLARPLSEYLYEQSLTFRIAKIRFYVDKQEEEAQRINYLLEKII